jgi:shikimate kinase
MKKIILVGFMACGKTSLGKKLAMKLKIDFIDSDSEIEKTEGISIQEIFATKGENYFREVERSFLKNFKSDSNFVLACGGGLPCFNDNIELLNELGTTFYLKLSSKELAKRISLAKTIRPLTLDKTLEELESYVAELLQKREEFYSQAHFTLAGKEQKVNIIVDSLNE